MEFTLPLPHQLDTSGILSKQWATFIQRFQLHRLADSTNIPTVETTSLLLFAANHQISSLCETLRLLDIDFVKLNKVLDIIEKACLPHFILLFERFRYFTLEQDSVDSLNDFVTVLRKQGEICEFGDVKDSILTSALAKGVNNEAFRQTLQNSNTLSFDDAITMCNEAPSKSQTQEEAVAKKQRGPKKKTRAVSKTKQNAEMYMVPSYDHADEVADDDEIVKAVVKVTRKKSKVKEKGQVKLKKKITEKKSKKGPKIFLCFACNNEYATRKSFRRHVAAKHGESKEYYCIHCEKKFKNRTECITHCQGHNTATAAGSTQNWRDSTNSEHMCWYCNEIFPSLLDYKKHCQTHSAVRVFYCDLCGRKNHTVTRMLGHIKGHLASRHKCEICANCFGRPELLAIHMQTHVAQPVHQCQICSKNFVSADRLSGHMRTHSGEKRFTCELCGKSFCQKMSLDYHKRVHAGEKPYACDICGKRTASFGYLRKHKQMHSDKRPYVCEVCGKSFRFISNLNRHRNGHTGKRAFACDVCGRTFIYGEGLRDHIKAGRCPGRKSEGDSKRPARAPRPRVPNVPNPPMTGAEQATPYYPTTQHAPETLLSEIPPWPYMIRNNETDNASSLVVVPPYY